MYSTYCYIWRKKGGDLYPESWMCPSVCASWEREWERGNRARHPLFPIFLPLARWAVIYCTVALKEMVYILPCYLPVCCACCLLRLYAWVDIDVICVPGYVYMQTPENMVSAWGHWLGWINHSEMARASWPGRFVQFQVSDPWPDTNMILRTKRL